MSTSLIMLAMAIGMFVSYVIWCINNWNKKRKQKEASEDG